MLELEKKSKRMKQKKENPCNLKNALAELGQHKWREKRAINAVNYQYKAIKEIFIKVIK